ncbi:MAG: ABC transporter permease [Alphaproteobacteria bacterium]|nr:ABC transporter permease [Alphaproteobacteria bacterium]
MTAEPLPPAVAVRSRGSARRRIGAMFMRHWFLLRGSWPRILELIYWPTIQMVLWGFITLHFQQNSSWVAQAGGVLISGVLLWDILFRGQLGFTISFLEELYSRNLGQLFVTPIRPWELVVALMGASLVRVGIGSTSAAILASFIFGYSIFDLGLPLAAFFLNLMMFGWAVGIAVIAVLLRVGLGGESLAWLVIFLVAPVSAIYFPVEALPDWIEWLAWCLPPAYIFEGMRSVLFGQGFRWDWLLGATLLNIACMVAVTALFLWSFEVARRQGLLLRTGE